MTKLGSARRICLDVRCYASKGENDDVLSFFFVSLKFEKPIVMDLTNGRTWNAATFVIAISDSYAG